MTAIERFIRKVCICFLVIVTSTISTISSIIALVYAAVSTVYNDHFPMSALGTCIAGAVTFVVVVATIVVCKKDVNKYKHRRRIVFGNRRHDAATTQPVTILYCLEVWKYTFPSVWTLLAASHVGICLWFSQLSIMEDIEVAVLLLGIPVYLSCGVSFFLTPPVVKAIKLLSGNDEPAMVVRFSLPD